MFQKLKILCFIFLFANKAHAQNYGSPMADSLIVWLQRLKNQDFDGIDKPNAKPILGADKMDFENGNHTTSTDVYEDGAYINLKYLRRNKNSEKVYKNIKKAFTEILKDPSFAFAYDGGTFSEILQNNLLVLRFSAYTKKKEDEEIYMYIKIQCPKFPKIFMVNEASYKSSFPSTIKDTDDPQIWELKGSNNGQSYQRYNGIFKDGILIKGSKTFKGYDDFYDGTWYAKEWSSKNSYEVVFLPANKTDTVYGHFTIGNVENMVDFTPDKRYTSYEKDAVFGFKPASPQWLFTYYKTAFRNPSVHSKVSAYIQKTDEDHRGLGKQNENELAAINSMQQNLMLFMGTAAIGFQSYELGEKERIGASIFYASKPNPLMLCNEEAIEAIGTKTNYIAAYRTKQTRDLSMRVFMALPFINKSSITLKLEQEKNVDATEVQQFNLYLADKLVASYAKYLKQELSVIKVYQLSF